MSPTQPFDPESERNPAYLFCGALFDELARAGVEHVVVAPGSRSAPLAVAAGGTPKLRCWSVLDERCAGFFALGIGRASRKPAAVICTSGTALANLLPAAVEAHHARVPLLLLSADRPPELRDCGAGQTIEQAHLLGPHTRWFHEPAVPDPSRAPETLMHEARRLAARAVIECLGASPGPVHLNFPFREPLDPIPSSGPRTRSAAPLRARSTPGEPVVQATGARGRLDSDELDRLAARVREPGRGWIVCGPMDATPEFAAAVLRLAEASGWPVLADASSGLRYRKEAGKAVIRCADLLLRDESFARRMAPDRVLRFGDTPVSKALGAALLRARPRDFWLVDPAGAWREPGGLCTEVLAADPESVCIALAERLEGQPGSRNEAFAETFAAAESEARETLERRIDAEEDLSEAGVVREVVRGLPSGSTLVVANSMAVRDLEAFAVALPEADLRVIANRGANGIDGTVSTALGAAAVSARPSVLLCGDLAFLHDLGGLALARGLDAPLVTVVLNNDGGSIFSFLPIAEHAESFDFEALFRQPHGRDLSHAAALFDLDFERVADRRSFREVFAAALSKARSSVIEVRLDADTEVERFRSHARAVIQEAAAGPADPRP